MNQDIRIQLDFEVTPELVELYRDSTESPFLGYSKSLTLDEAWEKMTGYSLSQTYGKFKRLAIMKIFLRNKLIGFSFPRQILPKEFSKYKIPGSVDWYRLGTIFIDDVYRGKGVIKEVVKLFRESYPNLIWQCNAENEASCKAAVNSGFTYTHSYYMDNELSNYVFEEFHPLFPKAYKVFVYRDIRVPMEESRSFKIPHTMGGLVNTIGKLLKDFEQYGGFEALFKPKSLPPRWFSVEGITVDLNEVNAVNFWYFQITPTIIRGIRVHLKNGKIVDTLNIGDTRATFAHEQLRKALLNNE